MSASWSGQSFLETVAGPLEQFPPVRVLFLAHRVSASGRLTLRWQQGRTDIDLRGGKVVGCQGAPHLLKAVGVQGVPGADLAGLLNEAFRAGVSPEKALEAAAEGLGDLLAATVGVRGGEIRFDPVASPSGPPMPLTRSVPQILATGLLRARRPEQIRQALAPALSRKVAPSLPDDAPESRWGLSPVAMRLLREAKTSPSLARLLHAEDPGREDEWQAAWVLLQLGLLKLKAAQDGEKPADRPASAAEKKEPSAEQALKETLERLQGQTPWQVLELTSAADISDEGIDRAFRDVSTRYHPDRFAAQNADVRELAAQCFSRVTDAREALQEPGLREDVRKRLEAEKKGEKYVSNQDKLEAEVAYARAQVAFRKRAWAEAVADYGEADKLNPTIWRYKAMLLRAQWHAGLRPGLAVADELAALEGPRGPARGEHFFEIAEILFREGADERGYEMCQRVVEILPEHIGARRRLRLRDMRQATEVSTAKVSTAKVSTAKPPATRPAAAKPAAAPRPAAPPPASGGGLLGGLFKRKKD